MRPHSQDDLAAALKKSVAELKNAQVWPSARAMTNDRL